MTKDQQIINKIKEWLEDVVEINRPTLVLGILDEVDKGWLECAEGLLGQIETWEKEQ